MPKTVLDIELLKGEDFTLSTSLGPVASPFDLSNYVVYFTIVEDYGMTPVIDVNTSQVGQTVITVAPLLGQIEVKIPYSSTKFEFMRGHYSLGIKSTGDVVTFLLIGDIIVIPVAKDIP